MDKSLLTSPLVQRLAVLAGAIVLGAVCTHWGLQVRQSLQAPVADGSGLPQVAAVAAPNPASLHLFGVNADTAGAASAAPPPNLRLIGVIAGGQGSAAVAILAIDGKATPVRRGDALGGGSVLRDILRDRVVVDTNGQSAEVILGDTGAATLPAAAGALPMQPMPGGTPTGVLRPLSSAPNTVPPFKLEVQSLGPNHLAFSKAELGKALADPRLAASMGKASPSGAGGLLLEDVPAGSLSERIGLHPGDILRSANGQTLVALSDLPRLYQEFGTAGTVRLEIVRGGQPTILQYTMRP